MTQKPLFDGVSNEDNAAKFIGQRLYLEFKDDIQTHVALYHKDVLVKAADLTDKVAKKFFVIEAVELGATKTRLADVLNISRQTIHNYQETKKHFGLEGLIRNYTSSKGETLRQNREAHADEALKGNKARQLEQMRKRRKSGWIHKLNSLSATALLTRKINPSAKNMAGKQRAMRAFLLT